MAVLNAIRCCNIPIALIDPGQNVKSPDYVKNLVDHLAGARPGQ